MEQITTIEQLQDAIALNKEIYEIELHTNEIEAYTNSNNEIFIKKWFKLWNFEDHKDSLRDWVKTKTLFSTDELLKKYEMVIPKT